MGKYYLPSFTYTSAHRCPWLVNVTLIGRGAQTCVPSRTARPVLLPLLTAVNRNGIIMIFQNLGENCELWMMGRMIFCIVAALLHQVLFICWQVMRVEAINELAWNQIWSDVCDNYNYYYPWSNILAMYLTNILYVIWTVPLYIIIYCIFPHAFMLYLITFDSKEKKVLL